MQNTIERKILNDLVTQEEFFRKTLPFLKEEYFQLNTDKILFNIINDYIDKYNVMPSKSALEIELDSCNNVSEDDYQEMIEFVRSVERSDEDVIWSVDKTEQFCKDKAIYNAVYDAMNIIDGTDKTQDRGIIPDLLSSALGVTFDSSVGHDYILNAEDRFEFYHQKQNRVAMDIDILNQITKGGFPSKTLSCIIAGTGVGKSLAMCSFAAGNLKEGKNVLYITMEMAEERISERIDANLMNITVDNLHGLSKDMFMNKISDLQKNTLGQLVVKEYPTSSAGAGNFRFLLNELKVKKNFVPDIIYIDYLNICASSRLKNNIANSYLYIKSIAEELRGLAVEYDLPIITATQTNRDGINSSDIDLTNTSESMGAPMTFDFMMALIATEELDKMNQLMIKQLKNRFGDPNRYGKFCVGIDRSKMKLYNLETSANHEFEQNVQENNKPVFDNTEVGKDFNNADFKF